MIRVAILDDYQNTALRLADWRSLGADVEITAFDRHLAGTRAAAEALENFDVLSMMRERMPLTAELIQRLPNLKLVVVTGARTQSIDFEAAVRQGITVCHTGAGESRHVTPELAFGLILACARSIPDEHRHMREGGWQHTIGTALGGRTLGLLGLGKLGSRMAAIARAFEMHVLAYSSNLTAAQAEIHGARRVDLDELLGAADVVSIHLVLGERTRELIGAREIALMPKGAILINTSRGPIVDEAALVAALEQGRIRAGLDVYDQEPLPTDHPFRRLPNIVTTPHIGYVTEGAYRMFFEDTVEAIAAWTRGKPIRVLAAPAPQISA